ncbi:MAG: hypothetical protein QG629_760 [Patescibacteria group bacterium]|nr:hypothetical protein [Candidatus Saccharibacteria bacterium]MDQ5963677.1 hypothetical protein [Patescibacteria group bacterium]
MIEHHIQRQIIRLLGATSHARFTDIKPNGLANNAFQYHLKQLMSEGIVGKHSDGTYELTPKGTGEYITSHLTPTEAAAQAHAIFLLAIQDGDKWLLVTRNVKPQQGLAGFLHGEPVWNLSLQESARQRLESKTGLRATFEVRGSGYIRMISNGAYSSFVHATLLHAYTFEGVFDPSLSFNTLAWHTRENLEQQNLIPSMPHLWNILNDKAEPFFDLTFDV